MVLAACGTKVDEATLERQVRMEEGGIAIEELQRAARGYGLVAEIEETKVVDLRRILVQGKLPITYVNRSVFDLRALRHVRQALGNVRVHAVIPTRITADFVTFHDPRLAAIRRKSIIRFACAHQHLGCVSLVCAVPPED
jgi:hypothetical protein